MKINLIGLQKHTIQDYNELVELFNSSNEDCDFLIVNYYRLKAILNNLHKDLATFGSLMDENENSYFDEPGTYLETLKDLQ